MLDTAEGITQPGSTSGMAWCTVLTVPICLPSCGPGLRVKLPILTTGHIRKGTLLVVQPNVIDGRAGVQVGNSLQITPAGAISTQRYPVELTAVVDRHDWLIIGRGPVQLQGSYRSNFRAGSPGTMVPSNWALGPIRRDLSATA